MVARYGKWIEGIRPDDPVSLAAKRTLQRRVTAVIDYLDLAARCAADNPEYVHQLRVQSRRASAALNLYRKILRKKSRRWFCDTLRSLRRAAGEARDLDVLAENIRSEPQGVPDSFLEGVQLRRAAAQGPIVAWYEDLNRGKRLRKQLARLLKYRGRKRAAIADQRFGAWAIPQLRRIAEPFLQAAASNVSDLTSLHAFRIHAKKVRYAMELLAAAFPDSFRRDLYPLVSQLQERLGKIHDQAVARNRLLEWTATGAFETDVRTKRKMIARECQRLSETRQEYQTWWTPALQRSLRLALHRLWAEESADATDPAATTNGANEIITVRNGEPSDHTLTTAGYED